MSTVQQVAQEVPSIRQKNAYQKTTDIIGTYRILALQLSGLPGAKWPREEDYTLTSTHREYNKRRLDENFIKDC